MHKKIGSIFLVSGSCIGSGMIALPIVLAQIGLMPSLLIIILIWALTYYASIINIELNIKANNGLNIGALAKIFAGKNAEIIGTTSTKILSYALLAVFIYGGSSILQKLLSSQIEISKIEILYSALTLIILLLPMKFIEKINSALFIALLAIILLLIAGLFSIVQWHNLPLTGPGYKNFKSWCNVIPIVFTSFGFQLSIHSIFNYCQKEQKTTKHAFLFGTLIPVIIYTVWTLSVIGVMHNKDNAFYSQMTNGNVDVGTLIQKISDITQSQSIKITIWWISLLAIFTSLIGVGIGLNDSIKQIISKKTKNTLIINLISTTLTIVPSFLIAYVVPNAFIRVLSFAGMMLAFISIIMPIFLFYKSGIKQPKCKELKNNFLIKALWAGGFIVIISEAINILFK